jgi:F-type H+-transporting ATPase subunit a
MFNHYQTIASPLDQFEIRNLFSIDTPLLANMNLSITNIGLYMTIAAFIAFYFSVLATNHSKITPNSWSLSQETLYATIHSIVVNQINNKSGQAYFPFMYALFIFILINNLIGMIPYSFASTSHFILTFSLSFTVVLGATVLGFKQHGLKFFSLFVPAGCPLGLLPLLVLIEFISYLARNVSLGLRLAPNILYRYTILNTLSGFKYKCVKLQGLVHNPPKPHAFSSISLKSSSIGTDTVQEWISAKADLKKEYDEVKADYLSTKKELKEANSVLTLCNLVQESQNSAIGPMKQKFSEFFDEESGNDTKQGVMDVVSHLKQEVASLKYEHNTLEKQIADYENKIDKWKTLNKETESSNVNSILFILVRRFDNFVYLQPLLKNVLTFFSLSFAIVSLLVSLSIVFPIIDVPCTVYEIIDNIKSFFKYEIAISLPLLLWSFYSYYKKTKRYLDMVKVVIQIINKSHYLDIWLLLLMFTVTILFF